MSTVAETAASPAFTRRAIAPAVVGVAGVAMTGVLTVVDPSERSVLPACPFHAATGLWCPGCGLTRATHALIHFDVAAMAGFNVFAPLVLAALTVAWFSWMRVSLGGEPVQWLRRVPNAAWITVAVVGVAFAIARNTDQFSALAP